jgi:hypothetical protein
LPVLLEKPGRKAGQIAGRSPYLQAVHIEAREQHLGEIVLVSIIGSSANSLTGVIIHEHDSDSVGLQDPHRHAGAASATDLSSLV